MEGRSGIISVKQEVDIRNDHFFFARGVLETMAPISRSSAILLSAVGSIPSLRPIGFALILNGIRFEAMDFLVSPARMAALIISLNDRRELCIASRSIFSTSLSNVTVVLITAS